MEFNTEHDKINVMTATLHLQEASSLLLNIDRELSDFILVIANKLIELDNLKESDFKEAKDIEKNLIHE